MQFKSGIVYMINRFSLNSIQNIYINGGKFSSDTLFLLSSQILVLFGGFGLTFFITQSLGIEKLGLFNEIISYYNVLVILFSFGLNNALVKKVSENMDNEKKITEYFSSCLIQTFLQSSLLSIILFLIIYSNKYLFSSEELGNYFWLMLIAIPFYNLNKNFDSYYTGIRNQKMVSINRAFRWLLMFLIIMIVCLSTKQFKIVVLSIFGTEFILLFINLICQFKNISFSLESIKKDELMKFGMATFPAEVISALMSNIDIILLGYLLSKFDLGKYSFILFFSKTLLIFPGVVAQNLNPIISKLWFENKKEELKHKFQKIFKINLLISIVFLVVILCLYIVYISVWNPQFFDTFYLFFISLIGMFIVSLISWLGGVFIMIGQNRINNYRTIIFSFISTIVILFLSSNLGLIGACLSVLVNGIITAVMITGLLKKTLDK
jgi:O-antigen/teichoic acid export membrane protein